MSKFACVCLCMGNVGNESVKETVYIEKEGEGPIYFYVFIPWLRHGCGRENGERSIWEP